MSNIANEKGSISESHGICTDEHHNNGGDIPHPLSTHTYVHNSAPQQRVFANPGPLGLFSYATTMFILSLYNLQAHGVTVPNAVVGMACFVGGLAQFVAGMWEFVTGNLFGATAFSLYGGFWLAYAAILHPGFGVSDAYADHPGELGSAIGIFLAAWFIITFIFLLASLRTNVVMVLVFFFLESAYLLLMVGSFSGSLTIHKMGGGVGIASACAAYYSAAAGLLTEELSWFTLPIGPIPRHLFS